jgi:metallo-beta-lactamase family protein
MTPSLTSLGGAGTVTGSKHLLELGGLKILVDCGLFQGPSQLRARNWQSLSATDPTINAESIDTVVLTHAHIDHSGYLPRLMKDGFSGRVIATRATRDLLRLLLTDSGHLQEEGARYHNRKRSSRHKTALPLYTAKEGGKAAKRVEGLPYDDPIPLSDQLSVRFRRAGHILGSATLTFEHRKNRTRKRIVFSGDLGRSGAPILPNPSPIGPADIIVVESTYGNREHDKTPIADQLEPIVLSAVEKGGAILVPAFAIGRTQELMYHLSHLELAGRIPTLPAYVDSPMAIEATEIYCAHPEDFEGDMRGMVMNRNCPLHCRDFRLSRSVHQSKAIGEIDGPLLIISASGMLSGGRVLHHLRQRMPDKRNTLLMVGYQAHGTRGRQLLEGAKELRIFGQRTPVRADVEIVHGLSAHADASGLLHWLESAENGPEQVFVVHGEPDASATLAETVRRELQCRATVPEPGERYELT